MNNKKVSPIKVLLHIFLIFLTGGLWGLYLLVRFLVK